MANTELIAIITGCEPNSLSLGQVRACDVQIMAQDTKWGRSRYRSTNSQCPNRQKSPAESPMGRRSIAQRMIGLGFFREFLFRATRK